MNGLITWKKVIILSNGLYFFLFPFVLLMKDLRIGVIYLIAINKINSSMTAQEIVSQFAPVIPHHGETSLYTYEQMVEAVELAKAQDSEFAEWISGSLWKYSPKNECWYSYFGSHLTTQELFEYYLKNHQNERMGFNRSKATK